MVRKWITFSLLIITAFVISNCENADTSDVNKKVPVEVAAVELGEIRQTINFTGDIKAEFQVNVYSKIPDRIEKYFVDDGDQVQKGSPIAKILSVTTEQGVLQAEAGLSAALAQKTNMTSEYARAKKLYNEDAMSQQQFDAVQTQFEAVTAQVEQAQAALTSAKSYLTDATVSAPITGIIGKRYQEAGDMASPAVPLASVVKMDRVKMQIEVSETDLGRLVIGQDSYVTVRSYPEKRFEGRLVKISPILDSMTRMATAEILIPNPGFKLKPGMFAEAEITTGILSETIVIPRYCVLENNTLRKVRGLDQVVKEYYVYVVNDSSRAERRTLDVEYINHQYVAVQGGITVGEKLVISGQNNLRQDALVLISDEEAR